MPKLVASKWDRKVLKEVRKEGTERLPVIRRPLRQIEWYIQTDKQVKTTTIYLQATTICRLEQHNTYND